MPLRPFCATPSCPGRAALRSRHCPTHQSQHVRARDKEYKSKAPARRALYNSKAWRIIRPLVLARDPICRICNEHPSTEVDHITALQDGGAPLDMANLQGACQPCHSRKTREEIERRKRQP